ncbi:MAG: valine--tRNA ligase [Fibrobacterales bacterium]
MESRFSPQDIENKWLESWIETGSYKPSGEGEPFSIVIPPPNVTGALHLGHALNNTIQDTLIRWQRKMGKNTLWVPGTDHAGIATQAVVERRLFENEQKTRHDIGRDALVKRIWDWKDEYEKRICGQLRKVGSSCDWDRQRFTLDPICAKAVRHTFFNLFKKNYIFRGKRLVNWDTHLQTAVADDEIYYETVQSHMWYFKYYLADGSGFIPVATTRPETILGDTALAVHPEDSRYKSFIGKMLKVPFVNREIPVIADGMLVDPEFGTGSVKVTPAHDPNDYATGLRHSLPMINILTNTGHINENGAQFAGMERYDARKAVVAELEALDLMIKVEDHEVPLGHSDRSKTPIEPYLSDQWFVDMKEIGERALDAVRQKSITFYPERYSKTYLDWLGEKRDWCISRQLWWGHQIPIWYCSTCSEADLDNAFSASKDTHWIKTEDDSGWLVCSLDDIDEKALGDAHTLTRDPDVLDTWFSSALWPHSTLGWPEQSDDLKTFYPTSVLVTSRDIISLWVARMVVTGLENIGEIPFSKVYIHPKILDGEGRTMSKSLGNGVDPLDIIEKYGTDALRFTMAQLCTDTQDARLPVKLETLEDGRTINTSDKFELGRNFANKLWNACRFVEPHLSSVENLSIDVTLLTLEDKWILSRINSTIQKVESCLTQYRFSEMVQVLYHFTWDDFCSRYLEIKKKTITAEVMTSQKANGLAVFSHVVEKLIGAMHPVMPFITEELNTILFPTAQALITSPWPKVDSTVIDQQIEKDFSEIFEIVEAVRSIRGQYSISPAKELDCYVKVASEVEKSTLNENAAFIKVMGKLSALTIDCADIKPPFSATQMMGSGEVYIPLEGILDKEKELEKLTKELTGAEKFSQSLAKKLSNDKFVNNAPANVVAFEKDKLKSQLETIEKCKKAIAELTA